MPWSLMLISLIALCNANTKTKLMGETSQSSAYISGYGDVHGSERAIDGDKEKCSHTGRMNPSWWSIDLLAVYRIDSINIYNKQSVADPNITGAQIYIGNSREKNGTTLCTNITSFNIGVQNTFKCDTNVSGRYITVFFPENKFLILCEVEIYGTIKESPFELIRENKTWEDALDHCRDRDMNLASIVDKKTQAWAELEAKNSTTPVVWLGLRYTCTLEFWFWVDGLPLQFTRWAPNGKIDDCNRSGAMETQGNHSWFSKQDTEKYNFICA